MFRRWILVADASHARILFSNGNLKKARQVETWENEKAHLHRRDLTTDRPGRVYQDGGSGHGSAAEEADPKEHLTNEFARKLAHALDAGRQRNDFERLAIVSPPHFLGLVKGHLTPATAKLLDQTVAKDMAREPTPKLLEHLESAMG